MKSSVRDGRLNHPIRLRGCYGPLSGGGVKVSGTSRVALFNMLQTSALVGDISIDVDSVGVAWSMEGKRAVLFILWHA